MTVILPLEPQEEAKLIALAQQKGLRTDDLLLEAVNRLLAEAGESEEAQEPTRSLRGILAKYGPAPSAAEIDENRREMFANFPRSDF